MNHSMKNILKNTAYITAFALALGACAGKQSPRPAQVTTVDKEMSCEELQLEMNDVQYLRQTAEENRGANARNILWPFSYPSTYLSADEALASADRRLGYLQRVYTIKECKRPLI